MARLKVSKVVSGAKKTKRDAKVTPNAKKIKIDAKETQIISKHAPRSEFSHAIHSPKLGSSSSQCLLYAAYALSVFF